MLAWGILNVCLGKGVCLHVSIYFSGFAVLYVWVKIRMSRCV